MWQQSQNLSGCLEKCQFTPKMSLIDSQMKTNVLLSICILSGEEDCFGCLPLLMEPLEICLDDPTVDVNVADDIATCMRSFADVYESDCYLQVCCAIEHILHITC